MENTDRRYYELWYRYLKHNKEYRQFLEYMRRKKEPGVTLPSQFGDDPERISHPVIFSWAIFGDIYSYEFDDWWDTYKRDRLKQAIESLNNASVSEWDMTRALDHEMAERFKEGGLFCVLVNTRYPLEVLVKRFSTLVKQKKDRSRKIKLSLNKLECYLKVYEAYELRGDNWNWDCIRNNKDIMRLCRPKDEDIADDRTFWKYLQKARQIVRNAGWGIFPGRF